MLEWELSSTPSHVAVIQDGNRRYARKEGKETTEGHVEGAETTEALLHWSDELDIDEVTLYAFSTENFNRPEDRLPRPSSTSSRRSSPRSPTPTASTRTRCASAPSVR